MDNSGQQPQSQDLSKMLTPATIVTIVRIALIPVFIAIMLAPWPSWFPESYYLIQIKPWLAAVVFALLAITDSLDGYLARSRNEVTTLGKFLDPLADKILVSAALLALIELGELPTWPVLVIIAREFLVSGLRMVLSAEGQVVAASNLGKVKTVFQIIAIILFILKTSPLISTAPAPLPTAVYIFAWLVMTIALVLTLVSMADYFIKAASVLGLPLRVNQQPQLPDTDAARVIELAASRSCTLGTAESCTGGLIAATLTSVPGSSAVFKGGIVSYANEVKQSSLGVSAATLESYGAVSEQTARQMAIGARQALNADITVSTTGIAGPGGGSADKPVGTVWFGLAHGDDVHAECHHFQGSRRQVRQQARAQALALLESALTRPSV
jgi:CDP-diacylglycerol--glycerol-3-phosphate 3-phosphatidyltransferase